MKAMMRSELNIYFSAPSKKSKMLTVRPEGAELSPSPLSLTVTVRYPFFTASLIFVKKEACRSQLVARHY